MRALTVILGLSLTSAPAFAAAEHSRSNLSGYARLLARPDLSGGEGRLGFWNLYGRLLNEGPWLALEPRVTLLEQSGGPWSELLIKIEGPGPIGVDGGGSMEAVRISQAYVRAAPSRQAPWSLRIGSLDTWFGDLGLYDWRPASMFGGTIGASVEARRGKLVATVGLGDSGFAMHPDRYNAVLTGGAALHYRSPGLVLGLGAQLNAEPAVEGKPSAPHATPDVAVADLLRGEVVERFLEGRPGQEDFFPKPEARNATSYAIVAELGFGGWRRLPWWQSFLRFERMHPVGSTREWVDGREFTIFLADLTDERERLTVGTELQLAVIPGRLDLWWGAVAVVARDGDNSVAPSDQDMMMASTVLRAQAYLRRRWALLVEGSVASERSVNGNRWRASSQSIEANDGGAVDSRGLEYGDLDQRLTQQFKGGVVFSPRGRGLFARPALRLLYGLQRSNENNAFGHQFETVESNINTFQPVERHIHHLIALEAETWF